MRSRLQSRTLVATTIASFVALAACTTLRHATSEGDAGEAADEDGGGEAADAAPPDAMKGKGGGGDDADVDGQKPPAVGPSCTSATCTTETFLADLYGPVSIASSGQFLYFAEVGSSIPQGGGYGWLSRVPTDESCTTRSCFGTIEPLLITGELEGQNIFDTHLALGPTDICVTQSYNASPEHAIYCYDLVNYQKRTLESGTGLVVDLWTGGTEARWPVASQVYEKSPSVVRARPLTGGTAANLTPVVVGVTSVTSDGSNTFFTEYGPAADAGAVATSLPDGGVYRLVTGRQVPTGSALYGGYVYWVETAANKVMRTKADGTGSPELVANTSAIPFALAVDASGVYWAASGSAPSGVGGVVEHTTIAPNGPVDVMMKDLSHLWDIAIDGTHVYAATIGADIPHGAIYRMKKVP